MAFSKNKTKFWLIISILIILAMGVTFVPLFCPVKSTDITILLVYFFGICQVILVTGLILTIFFFLWIGFQCYKDEKKASEKTSELAQKKIDQERLVKEVEQRRRHDDTRNRINDFFRLIELVKEKTDTTEKKSNVEEKSEPVKTIQTEEKGSKTEGLNLSLVINLLAEYQKSITIH